MYFSEGVVAPTLQSPIFYLYFPKGVVAPVLRSAIFLIVYFSEGVVAPALNSAIFYFVYFSEGVVAPTLCSAIRQRSYDQVTTCVRCQSQCSKSKGTYWSDDTSHFMQLLLLRILSVGKNRNPVHYKENFHLRSLKVHFPSRFS